MFPRTVQTRNEPGQRQITTTRGFFFFFVRLQCPTLFRFLRRFISRGFFFPYHWPNGRAAIDSQRICSSSLNNLKPSETRFLYDVRFSPFPSSVFFFLPDGFIPLGTYSPIDWINKFHYCASEKIILLDKIDRLFWNVVEKKNHSLNIQIRTR